MDEQGVNAKVIFGEVTERSFIQLPFASPRRCGLFSSVDRLFAYSQARSFVLVDR